MSYIYVVTTTDGVRIPAAIVLEQVTSWSRYRGRGQPMFIEANGTSFELEEDEELRRLLERMLGPEVRSDYPAAGDAVSAHPYQGPAGGICTDCGRWDTDPCHQWVRDLVVADQESGALPPRDRDLERRATPRPPDPIVEAFADLPPAETAAPPLHLEPPPLAPPDWVRNLEVAQVKTAADLAGKGWLLAIGDPHVAWLASITPDEFHQWHSSGECDLAASLWITLQVVQALAKRSDPEVFVWLERDLAEAFGPDLWAASAGDGTLSGRLKAAVQAIKGDQARPEAPSFAEDLRRVINRHSAENDSDTPDFILADYVLGCLDGFAAATHEREHWYGRESGPPAGSAPEGTT